MKTSRVSLPIDPILPELVKSLEASSNLVLKAAPGSGKTTRVPPALLSAAFAQGREILVLEPRRLAAKYSARRVAQELGEEIGRTVGYQFRFERVGGRETRLKYMTEGMLMRRLLGEPQLDKVAAVILDEFHERHLQTDLALAYLRYLQKKSRPDLRIIVMSATLDTQAISRFLGDGGDCPILEVNNRPYPVALEHLANEPSQPLELLVRDAALKAMRSEEYTGHILVFLPGMGEIRRAEQALDEALSSIPARDRPRILPLHGELAKEAQDEALAPSDRRKIILSTNVAETSLTIDGVTWVIDSGLHRMATYSWWSGVPALRTRPISRASAIQRAGRAGRTAPGKCLRLYTAGAFEQRPPFDAPEITRTDLCQPLLELKMLGAGDLDRFEWFEAPAPNSLSSSWTLLYRLGALTAPAGSADLTEIGRRLAALPAHPRIARFLLEAQASSVLEPATTLAALITEGLVERLDAIDELRSPALGDRTRRVRSQLTSALSESPALKPLANLSSETDRIRFSLLTGFPDRVSRKRAFSSGTNRGRENETELVFSSGGSARIEDSGVIRDSELFVTLDMQEQQHLGQVRSTLRVRCLTPIREEWLFDLVPTSLEERDEYFWNRERERVFESSSLRYDQLILSESQRPARSSRGCTTTLLREAIGFDLARAPLLPLADWTPFFERLGDAETIRSTLGRIALLEKNFAPSIRSREETIESLIERLDGINSSADLRTIDWPNELPALFAPELMPRLESLLPSVIHLPSGRKAKVHYEFDKSPWIESRLQDFFGMKKAPQLLDGRVPLTLHLLAPNYRAVQVTTDLAGFWEREYPTLRKTLSRRYPRHSWPENP